MEVEEEIHLRHEPRWLPIVIFVFILSFPSICDCSKVPQQVPAINKCCAEGSFYSFDQDECIGIKVRPKADPDVPEQTSGLNEFLLENTQYSAYGTEPLVGDSITLPQQMIINLSNDTDTDSPHFTFRLDSYFPNTTCTKGYFIVQVQVNNKNKSLESMPEGNNTSGYISSNTVISANFTSYGQVKIGNEYYSPPEYCIIGLKDELLAIRVCNATCSGKTPCIRKCCDLNQVWNIAHGMRQGCSPAGGNFWTPKFFSNPKTETTSEERQSIHPHYTIMHPRYFCNLSSTSPIAIEQRDELGRHYWKFRVNLEGHVFRRVSRYTWLEKDEHPSSYCLDGAINSRYLAGEVNETGYSGAAEDAVLFECLPPTSIDARPQSLLYGTLMAFSCVFLILTITVHIMLWDRQPNHAWTLTLISYDFALLGMYFFFMMMHFSQIYMQQAPGDQINTFCYAIGVGVNFFIVSTFCWMSAVNFDLFRTFKVLKPTSGRSNGLRRYLKYAFFAWMVPITIVTVGIVLDSLYRNDFDSGIIIPDYGRKRCHLDAEYAQLVYAYGPAGVLIIFNLMCFAVTVYTMYSVQKSTKFATTSSSKKHKQKQSLKLFAKLLFVMGFPWIFEIISWYIEKNNSSGNSWYWILFDIVNILQALAIFWTFVCKPDVIRMLEQKYPCFERFLDRIMMNSESAEKFSAGNPTLKKFVKPITRRNKESVSGGKNSGRTEISSMSSSSNAPDSLKMQGTKTAAKVTNSSSLR